MKNITKFLAPLVVLFSALSAAYFFNSAIVFFAYIAFWLLYSALISKIANENFIEFALKDAFTYAPSLLFAFFYLKFLLADATAIFGISAGGIASIMFAKLLATIALSSIFALKVMCLPRKLIGKLSSALPAPPSAKKLVIAALMAYIAVFFILSLLRYLSFGSAPPDLWIFNQSMWHTLNGQLMYSSRLGASLFSAHSAIFLLFLLPVYVLFQNAVTLLLIQTIFIALGAIPLYLIARRILNEKFALLFAIAYLLYPALEFINLREFHPIALAIPLLLFCFYFLETRKLKYFAVALALALLVQEAVALTTFMLGLYAIFSKKGKRLGIAVCAVSLLYFLFAVMLFMPMFPNPLHSYLGSSISGVFSAFGNSPGEIISSIIFNPLHTFAYAFSMQKIAYLILLLAPIAFLSLFALPILLIALPIFAQNLLATPGPYASIYFQYNAEIIVFVFISAIYGASKLIRLLNNSALIKCKDMKANAGLAVFSLILAFSLLSNIFFSPSPLSALDPRPTITNFSPEKYAPTEHRQAAWQAISLIPENAYVLASGPYLAVLSSRNELYYFLPDDEETTEKVLGGANYILADASLLNAREQRILDEIISGSEWEKLFEQDRILLLKKKRFD